MNVSERAAAAAISADPTGCVTDPFEEAEAFAGDLLQAAPALGDARFRRLLGAERWAALPVQVRARFAKRLGPGEMTVYRGRVVLTELSRAGRVLAFLARAIGAPLPLRNGATGPAAVLVTEDERFGGQSWVRIYSEEGRRPQTIHSAKCFRGPTGLEENVGYGIGMALALSVEEGALVFRSDHYFLKLGGWRLRWPRLLEPGAMEITHRDEAPGRFSFRLRLTHPWLGRIVHQLAYFTDA